MNKEQSNRKIRLLVKVFKLLLDAVTNQFEDECRRNSRAIPSGKREYYGFDQKSGKNGKAPSLFNSMKNDQEKKAIRWREWKNRQDLERGRSNYIGSTEPKEAEPIRYTFEEEKQTVPAKFLYDKELDAKNAHPYQTLDFNEVYLTLCLKYVGHGNLESFMNDKDFCAGLSDDDKRLQSDIQDESKEKLSSHAVKFRGYYFSNKAEFNREVFELKMDFKNRHEQKTFPVELRSFHTPSSSAQDDAGIEDTVTYEGKAVEGSTFVHMQLEEQENHRPLNIFCHKKFSPIEHLKWMHAVVSGISKEGMPVTLEAILVREDAREEAHKKYFDAYLHLRRNNIRLPDHLISHPKELRSPITKTPVKDLEQLVGRYRVWNFRWQWKHRDKRGIIQSVLTIHPDFRMDIETVYEITKQGDEDERRKQHLVMSISHVRDHKRKLCLASHTPISDGMEVLNYAILNIEPGTEEYQVLSGVFCGQRGYRPKEHDTPMATEPLVLMKDSSDFGTDYLDAARIRELIGQSQDGKYPYQAMLATLFSAYGLEEKTAVPRPELDLGSPSLGKRERFLEALKLLYRDTLGNVES